MNRTLWGISFAWWAVSSAFLVSAIGLIAFGFWCFGFLSFSENLIAEAVGLLIALSVAIWVIEGRVLSRESRRRDILEYRRQVFQIVGEIGFLLAKDIAEPLANEFEPEIDLYGYERGNWEEFKSLLREIFRRLRDVRHNGLPPYIGLTEEDADSIMRACQNMTSQIRERINSRPDFANFDVLGGLLLVIPRIDDHIERAYRLDLSDDPIDRYVEIGELGELILDMTECITPLSEGSELW